MTIARTGRLAECSETPVCRLGVGPCFTPRRLEAPLGNFKQATKHQINNAWSIEQPVIR